MKEIILFFVMIFIIIAAPIFFQGTAYKNINEDKFKHYKIGIFSFLFKGMNGKSPSKDGLILPMFYIQLQGYIIGVACLITVLINANTFPNKILFISIFCTMFVHLIVIVLVSIITGIVSDKRDNHRK